MTGRLFDPSEPREATGPGEPSAPEETEAAPSGPLRRVAMLVAYDGSDFHGFAQQADPDLPTVGGRLSACLGQMAGGPVALVCAGRTDAGVHATGQVVHADLPERTVARLAARAGPGEPAGELSALARSLTTQLGGAIAVPLAIVAPEGFDARRSAVARRYTYTLDRGPVPDPLSRRTTWHVPGPLDLAVMRLAADSLLGEHDFTSFCKRPPGHEGPLTRRLSALRISEGAGSRLVLSVEANAFCHHMVRSIVAALVQAGQGRLSAADVHGLLRAADRSQSVGQAPPSGLVLVEVRYPDSLLPGGVLSPPGRA